MQYSDFNIEVPHNKVSGQVYTTCPKCSGDRKKKNNKCLGVDLDRAIWHCNHCDWRGSLNGRKKYILPTWENKTQLTDKVVEWFLSRNISQETLNRMNISEGVEYMPQVETERKVICFNYFRDGKLVNVKYRDAEKNFKLYKGAELIFYNLDGIKETDSAYIVEGEIDCLTMIQAGYLNTVSVPNGASKGKNNLQYLDNCYQYFENVKAVYILTDNDEPGNKLGEELARRIGIEKCHRIELGEFKDINEAYSKGADLQSILAQSNAYPIEGVKTISDHWEGLINIMRNGMPQGWKPRGKLGEFIQFHPRYTTIVTGIPGHGKSELLDQILMQISVDYNLRGAYFSPENRPTELHLIKLIEKIIGKNIHKANDTELTQTKRFLDNRVMWIYPQEGYTIDNILDRIRQCVLRHGINWYVLDPWNKLEHQYTESETKYISETLDKIANFNHRNGCHGFIVAHPTKMKFNHERNRYEVPGLYDVSGSANFYNKSDIGLTVYREPAEDPGVFKTSVYVQKVKFKHWGSQGQIFLYWNPENGRYDDIGIDYTNWIAYNKQAELIDEVPF